MTEERNTLSEEFDRLQEMTDDQVEQEITIDKPRDDKGRFRPKEAKAEEPEETPAVEEEAPAEEITDQGNEPVAEPAEQPLSPPERWSAEWKTKFAALPRDAQQVLLDREGEYDKGFTQKSQEAADYKRRYEPIDQILAPRRQQFAMQGMTEEQGLTQLFALSDFAANDPMGFIKMFAQGRGIDLASLVQTPENAPALPPEIAPIAQELNALKQQLSQQQRLQQQQQEAETQRQIQAFKSEPGHEHFEEVRADMAALLQSGRATDMKDAYDKACWANPSVRQRFIEAQTAEAARKTAEQQALAARTAKKAAGTVIAAKPAVSNGKAPTLSMRETMSRAYDEVHGVA